MADQLTVAGVVATPVKHTITSEGLDVSQFRLASSNRRFDTATRSWVDGETNWYTIVAFRHLAANLAASLDKGQRVLVTGRLRVRDWRSDDKKGTSVEIVADAVGHDLAWGTARFTRTPRASTGPAAAEDPAPVGDPSEASAAEAFPEDAREPAAVPF
ncbi:MAG: single-stranded DNA-binding protein [Microbacteriaceae bacterium]|nr:MAG: single-stranded DNA-binding protein [Microbacteriaceae bacterium]